MTIQAVVRLVFYPQQDVFEVALGGRGEGRVVHEPGGDTIVLHGRKPLFDVPQYQSFTIESVAFSDDDLQDASGAMVTLYQKEYQLLDGLFEHGLNAETPAGESHSGEVRLGCFDSGMYLPGRSYLSAFLGGVLPTERLFQRYGVSAIPPRPPLAKTFGYPAHFMLLVVEQDTQPGGSQPRVVSIRCSAAG